MVILLIQFLIEIVVEYLEQKSLPSLEKFQWDVILERMPPISLAYKWLTSLSDSLENGLNVDADAPCSDLVKNPGQGNRIIDSVLTISDDDLEQPEVDGL